VKWNIDKALVPLEHEVLPGTSISRVLLDLTCMKREGVPPTSKQREAQELVDQGLQPQGWADRETSTVWCLAVGQQHGPKAFFYGHTIREAYMRARRALRAAERQARRKKTQARLAGAWGSEIEVRAARRGQPRAKRRRKTKRAGARPS